MRLVGMLDSPYVRRAAITLEYLGQAFTHEPVSVFTTFEQFKGINPVVKAPTLVLDDGTVLMESSLIISWIESTLPSALSLWSADASARALEFRAVGLALAACDKSVQRIYEQNLRPREAQFEPWIERVTGQLQAAFGGLELEASAHPELFARERSHAAIAAAIAWQFGQTMLGNLLPPRSHPALVRLSARMESNLVFARYLPDGPGVPAGSL